LATFIKKFDAHLHEHGFEQERPVDDIKGHQQGKIRGLTKLVNITEDVRRYAKENAIDESTAIEHGLRQKAE